MFVYEICGLALASEQRLGALEGAETADQANTRFRVDPSCRLPTPERWVVVRTFAGAEEPWLSVARLDDGYLLRVHGEADFRVDRDGTNIVCVPAPDCAWESTEQLLLDQILPQVLHLRGQPCFHASAVADADGRVVAFLGASGSGKSTLAASYAEARTLVSDDCLVVSLHNDDALVAPSYPSVRLWRESAEELVAGGAALPLASPRQDKVRLAMRRAPRKLSLRHLYILEETTGAPSLTPLRRRDALLRLADHLHRLDPMDRHLLERELAFLESIVSRVPVASLSYPRRFEDLAAVRALIDRPPLHSGRG